MASGDNRLHYGTLTRFLHWSIALLMLWQLGGLISKVTLGKEHALTGLLSANHSQVGTVLFVLIVLRVLWALMNRGNRPPASPGLLGYAGRLGHFALYAVMVLVPSAALLRAWGGERPFAPFGFEIFAARTPETVVKGATDFGNNFHGELGWVLLVLILGHIAMTLVHQYLIKDGLLKRMWG